MPDCSVTIAIAATRKPITNLRSKAAFDFAHKSGFYLGNWNSNVSSVLFNGASLEMDFYGGYKTTVGDFGIDVGVLYYYYPGTGKYVSGYKPDFFEGYIGGTWGPMSLKYFYGFTDYFDLKAPGVDTKGSQYLDFSVAWPFDGGWAVQAHAGWQKIDNGQQVGLIDDTYFDYKLGVTYDIAGIRLDRRTGSCRNQRKEAVSEVRSVGRCRQDERRGFVDQDVLSDSEELKR